MPAAFIILCRADYISYNEQNFHVYRKTAVEYISLPRIEARCIAVRKSLTSPLLLHIPKEKRIATSKARHNSACLYGAWLRNLLSHVDHRILYLIFYLRQQLSQYHTLFLCSKLHGCVRGCGPKRLDLDLLPAHKSGCAFGSGQSWHRMGNFGLAGHSFRFSRDLRRTASAENKLELLAQSSSIS